MIHINKHTLFDLIEVMGLHPYSLTSAEGELVNTHLVIWNVWINLGVKLSKKYNFSIYLDWKEDKCITISCDFIKSNKLNFDTFFANYGLPWRLVEYKIQYLIDGIWQTLPNITGIVGYKVRQQFNTDCDKHTVTYKTCRKTMLLS